MSAHRVNEVVSTDSKAVAVSACHQHGQFVIGKFQARGYREGPTVQCVHAIGVYEARQIGGTTNPANGDDIVIRNLQFDEGLLNGREDAKIATSGAPVGIDFAL